MHLEHPASMPHKFHRAILAFILFGPLSSPQEMLAAARSAIVRPVWSRTLTSSSTQLDASGADVVVFGGFGFGRRQMKKHEELYTEHGKWLRMAIYDRAHGRLRAVLMSASLSCFPSVL